MVAELGAYSQAGGDILFGTDIGDTNHYDTAMESTLMSQAGMNFRQTLAFLTTSCCLAQRSLSLWNSNRTTTGGLTGTRKVLHA
jgi:hypothetical protein